MRDEHDTRDDGAEETGTTRAGSARPTGKRPVRTGSVATLSRQAAAKKASGRTERSKGSSNPFKALRKYFREVVAELRKVIWPNRKQMVTYTAVVLIFVIFMVALISGVDLGFVKGIDWLFG